jgi:hypothetical protein
MKTFTLKKTVLALAMTTTIVSSQANADVHPISQELLKVPPATVYQAIHGQMLADTLTQIAQRSGITFKVNADLSQDIVTQSVAADSWDAAIKALLVDYNYTTIQEGKQITKVIITDHKNASQSNISHSSIAKTAAMDNVIVLDRQMKTLPGKYQSMPAGTVTPINLPVSAIMAVKDNSTVSLNLPMGQFNLAHDNTVDAGNGNQVWVGHLADEGEGYRVYLSQGAAGTMGMLTTPDGSYNIEPGNNGGVYLIDTNKLQSVGFNGDTLLPESTVGNITANASVYTSAQIAQLQANLTAAQTALNKANALVSADQAAVTTAQNALTSAQNAYNAANTANNQAYSAYVTAVYAFYANPTYSLLLAAYTSIYALEATQDTYNNAMSALTTATAIATAAANQLATDTAAAATVLANFNNAQASLNTAEGNSTAKAAAAVSNSTPVTVVDLMVVYTTVNQTQAYAQQRIGLLVTASNQAYIDSHINMQLRLVHTEPTTYSESNSNGQALADLANNVGAFATIGQKRSQYGADLVFLFRPLYEISNGNCGTTTLGFPNGGVADPAKAFGTISDGNSVDEAGYYCLNSAFTHEIGHSLGLVHDRPNANGTQGVFPYSYAWGVNGVFGTIMSYDLPMLMYFSTPLLASQCAGQACGYSQTNAIQSSDQTSSVNYTAPLVANYQSTKTVTPVLQ